MLLTMKLKDSRGTITAMFHSVAQIGTDSDFVSYNTIAKEMVVTNWCEQTLDKMIKR